MATIKLSNGEDLPIPDDATPDDIERYRIQGESFITNEGKLATPADNGTDPVPVEDHNVLVNQGQDYAKSWVPADDPFRAPKEWGSNVAQGALNLVNAVPNTVNTAKSLYDLHAGSGTGNVAPEDQWKPWVDVPQVGSTTPGWEGTQEAGQITGASAPLATEGLGGLLAATVGMPLMVKGGRAAGNVVDTLTGNQDTHKWAKTGELAAPLFFGGVRALKNTPVNNPLKIPMVAKAAFAGTNPELALSLLAAKMGIKGMDKALIGKPRGFGTDVNSMVKKSSVPLRLNDDKKDQR